MIDKPISNAPNADEPNSGDSNSDEPVSSNSDVDQRNDKPVETISEEEGLKSAEGVFKTSGNKTEDSGSDEDKAFIEYLKNRKKAKDLGLDEPSFTTIYQGGVQIQNSNVETHGSIVGNNQTNTGGFSGEEKNKSLDKQEKNESIESVFDRREDVKQRSFMIALAALNGCNYRTVVKASQKLQSILEPEEKLET